MKIAVTLLLACFLTSFADSQNVLTGKEIYNASCKAIVQITATDEGFGVGFVVSSDGTIVTANHAVTTRDSGFRQYVKDIQVLVKGTDAPYKAHPVARKPSEDDINFDSAVIRIDATELPYLTLGSWSDVDISDVVTVIPSFPRHGCILLEGIVSPKDQGITDFGWKPVKTILFQAPIRNGFSGAPIFDKHGHVVAIEDTKVFGISLALDALRKQWKPEPGKPDMLIGVARGGPEGLIPFGAGMTEMINNLDQNLISGLGSGVAIDYANEEIKNAK
jgi:S1-C subfamily serine protease